MALTPEQQFALLNAKPYQLDINQFTSKLTALILSQDAEFVRKAGKNFQQILKLYEQHARRGPAIAKVNQRIANKMVEGVIEGYNVTVERGGLKPASYRRRDIGKNKRFTGKLLYTIKNSNFAVGDEDGIKFINDRELNLAAKHWQRLNFGAGPNIGYEGVKFDAPHGRIRFAAGQSISIPGVEGEPRPNFSVPGKGFGYFNNEGQFYMLNSKTKIPRRSPTTGQYQTTRGYRRIKSKPSVHGIGARHFLDYGLVALGREFGPQYKKYFEELAHNAAAEAARIQAKKTEVSIRVPGIQVEGGRRIIRSTPGYRFKGS